MIEAHTYEVAPGAGLGGWFEHEGEDLLVVLEGEVVVEFADGQRHELAAGDVLWHVSTLAHRWTSHGRRPACCWSTPARRRAAPRTARERRSRRGYPDAPFTFGTHSRKRERPYGSAPMLISTTNHHRGRRPRRDRRPLSSRSGCRRRRVRWRRRR